MRLVFEENVDPSPEAEEWLEKVNAILNAEFNRQVSDLIAYGSATLLGVQLGHQRSAPSP